MSVDTTRKHARLAANEYLALVLDEMSRPGVHQTRTIVLTSQDGIIQNGSESKTKKLKFVESKKLT